MEKLEYFVVQPSTKLFGGIKVEEDTEFRCTNDEGTVEQEFKDGVLTTKVEKEIEYGGIKSKENSTMETEVPVGTILIWGEDTGYIIPNYRMAKPEEVIEMYKNIDGLTKPIEEGTEKAKGV